MEHLVPKDLKLAASFLSSADSKGLSLVESSYSHYQLYHFLSVVARVLRAGLGSSGAGRIDVILRRADLIIACEVSVTTTREHEYLNVTKCHRSGAHKTWVVAASERHRASLERFIASKLTETERQKTSFLTLDMVVIELEKLSGAAVSERVVKGWKVSATNTEVSDRARRVLMEGYLGEL